MKKQIKLVKIVDLATGTTTLHTHTSTKKVQQDAKL